MKYIFKTILLFLLLTAVPHNVAADEPTDSIDNDSGNMFQRGAGAVKNFFRGNKHADAQKQTKNTAKADNKDKSSKKPATREVAEKNYTVEQL